MAPLGATTTANGRNSSLVADERIHLIDEERPSPAIALQKTRHRLIARADINSPHRRTQPVDYCQTMTKKLRAGRADRNVVVVPAQ